MLIRKIERDTVTFDVILGDFGHADKLDESGKLDILRGGTPGFRAPGA
jgi:hypothetical protein